MPDLKRISKKNIETALFEAAILLGVNGTPWDKTEKVIFCENTFSKLSQKEGLCILHFLFTIIDKVKAAKTFRNFWPILDKKQDASFRRAAYEWFKELNQKENFGKRVVVSSIAAVTPGSQKFLQTILILLCHALYLSIISKENHGTVLMHPICSQQRSFNRKIKKLLQQLKKQHATNYAEQTSHRKEILSELNQTVGNLADHYQQLSEEEQSLQLKMSNNSQTDLENEIIQRNHDIKVMWELVTKFRNSISTPYSTIRALIDKGALTSIDGEALFRSSNPNNTVGSSDCLTNGQLNLVSAIRKTLPVLEEIAEQVQNSFGANTNNTRIREHVMSTDVSVAQVQEELADLNLSLSASIKSLHQQVKQIPSLYEDHCKAALRLCPPTPPYSTKGNPRESLMKTYRLFSLTPDNSMKKTFERVNRNETSLQNNSLNLSSTFQKTLGTKTPTTVTRSRLENPYRTSLMSACKNASALSSSVAKNNTEKESLQTLLERMNTLIDTPTPSMYCSPPLRSLVISPSRPTNSKPRRNHHYSPKRIDASPRISCSRNSYTDATVYHSVNHSPYVLSDVTNQMFSISMTDGSSAVSGETFSDMKSVNFELDKYTENSKLLPSSSLYSTVVEAFTAGEFKDEVIIGDEFSDQVRRESVIERRGSILALGTSNTNSPMFSEEFSRFSTSVDNLFDESDSCLITSFD